MQLVSVLVMKQSPLYRLILHGILYVVKYVLFYRAIIYFYIS